MKTKSITRKIDWSAAMYLLPVMLLLAGVLLLSQCKQWRIDLTQDKLYTLSDGSRHVVSSLQEPVNLTFYYSESTGKEIPALASYAERVQDMLNEYVRLSNGKVKLTVVHPDVFSEQEDDAAAVGLTPFPNGKGEKIYLGLAGERADQNQVIGFFNPQRENVLEYDISQLIFRLARSKQVTAEVISGLPVFRSMDYKTRAVRPPWEILDQLQKVLDIRQRLDNKVDAIEADVDLLLLIHPRLLPEKTLYAIDQFVLRGGKLLVFVDPVAETDDSEASMGAGFTDRSSDLEQLFTAWGVNYDPKKVLLDLEFAHSIPVTQYGRAVPHVGVLGLHDAAINRTQNVIAELDNINLASAGALSPKPGASTRFIPLLTSSTQSQLMDAETYVMIGNHETLLGQFKSGNQQYAFAALVSGNVKTAFPNGRPNAPAGEGVPSLSADTSQLMQSSQPAQVMIVADTDVLSDRMWVQVQDFYGQKQIDPFAANADMVVNMVEALTGSSELISLRSRGSYQRPFTRIDALEKAASNQFSVQQDTLMASLAETEKKITALSQTDKPATSSQQPNVDQEAITPEQQAAIAAFQQEKQVTRKALREVQHKLNADVEQLEWALKVINIAAVPAMLSVFALLLSAFRTRRARRI